MIYFGERLEVGETAEPFDFADYLDRMRPAWMDRGSCRQYPQKWWFPERGADVDRARGICDGCPVRAECLDWALTNGEHHGIWGGTSERERRRLRRRMA